METNLLRDRNTQNVERVMRHLKEKRRSFTVRRRFAAAKLISVHKIVYPITHSKVDKYPAHVIANCVYQCTCTHGDSYVERTERRASIRFCEHIPKNLCLKGGKMFTRAVVRHLMETGNQRDVSQSFKMTNKEKKLCLLRFVEAVTIRHCPPDLCTQKETITYICLPC
ncbi:unnamed protein product [Heterobilharzia americana]|nr:unnamed protein product [Heterobilharzia americana]CAH8477653.1 unnamed protein product [Heterobilharzia americana]